MEKKRGSSSLPAPRRASADYATGALVVLGISASLVFIGGSALLNYRMGFASAGNDIDGTIYGGLAAAGDGLKALCPFVAAYGWKTRDWLATAAAAIVFVVFTAFSFTSALGFSSQHRAVKEGTAAARMERHIDTRDTIRRDRERLDALGPQRSSAEVNQSILNRLNAPVGSGRWTVGRVSDGCATYKRLTREACARVADLRSEAARAAEAERLAAELLTLTRATGEAPLVQSADPQTDALTFLGRLLHLLPATNADEKDASTGAGFGLALLMAVFIELGSGLGLYIATTPWRGRNRPEHHESPSPPLPAIMSGPPLEAFMAECLERKAGHALHLAVAFEAYKDWCAQRHRSVQGRTRFERGLLKLAKELGLGVDSGVSGWVIRDVALRQPVRTSPPRLK
ncbi:MAG: hypothetical protein JSR99_03570 [Proteobacteria bacterium]|nr:hypothetical protein [Pseudomonadota bacterium]